MKITLVRQICSKIQKAEKNALFIRCDLNVYRISNFLNTMKFNRYKVGFASFQNQLISV